MKKFITFFLCFSFYLNLIFSQTAKSNMDINNIRATVLNGGDLFNGSIGGTFQVPKVIDISQRNLRTIYSAGLWIGGLDAQHKLHLAASTYRQSGNVFQPGPVSDSAYKNKQNIYDKIFYVTRQEIEDFKSGSPPSPGIQSWPGNGNTVQGEAQKLAPFMDKNKNNIYEPSLGDYPIIPGDACAFSIFNDDYQKNESLKIEVHQFVYEYVCNCALNNTLFVTYKIFNRSNNNYEDMHIGEWIDYDIGNYTDDAFCSDSTRNLMIAFNGDNDDEGILGYGLNPPAMGCLFLNHKLQRNIKYDNDLSSHGNPLTPQHYFNYLNGFYNDNTPIEPFKCFSASAGDLPADLMSLGSAPSFLLPVNSSYCLTVAHIFARATSGGAQGSVNLLKQNADTIQKYYNNKLIGDACNGYSFGSGITKFSENILKLSVYPNPAMGKIIVNGYLLMDKNTSFTIFNALGQTLLKDVMKENETEINVYSFAPGIYFIKVENEMVKFVKQ